MNPNFDRNFANASKLINKGQKTVGNMILVGAVQVITAIVGIVSFIVGLVTGSSAASYLALACSISFCLVLIVAAFMARRRAANFVGDISSALDGMLNDDDTTFPRR